MKKLTSLLVLLLFAGCSNEIQVYSDFDPDYDLKKYQTYNWSYVAAIESGKNPLHYNELNDKRIKSAVAEQLTSRGYIMSKEIPDLVVHYHIVVDDQSIITTEPYGYFYGPYWMRMHTDVYSYQEGTLIIDLMDAKTDALVWRGWAVSAITGEYTPQRIDRLVKKAVGKIFRNFPKMKGISENHNDVAIK